ncbi:MAG: hypothetical protein NTZ26_07000 [Candidatus Aminicenantes bacterium]|nr:hypothetical protein [Candidatus Aminicenantes bacterium]
MNIRWLLLWLLIPVTAAGQAAATEGQAPAQTPPLQVIRLEKVKDFALGADWEKLFKDYERRGSYKDLIRLPDGRLMVTDTRTYNFLIFGADGRFQERLWKKGRREAKALTIYNRPSWLSLWNDKLLFVSELGRVRVFDLDGKLVREAAIDHPVDCLVPLNETTAVVAGWVERTDAPNLHVIALVDLKTGRETVIRDMPEKEPKPYETKDGKKVSAQAPYARIRPFVRGLGAGEFAAGFTNWPEIEVFDAIGKQLRSFRIQAALPMNLTISTKSKDGTVTIYGSYLGYTPPPREKALAVVIGQNDPGIYYFNFFIDRQGRFLVFSFPEEGNAPIVRIFSPSGELVREAKIETGKYRITFSPGEAGPIFDGEYLTTLAEEFGASGVPLRLLKFRLAGL